MVFCGLVSFPMVCYGSALVEDGFLWFVTVFMVSYCFCFRFLWFATVLVWFPMVSYGFLWLSVFSYGFLWFAMASDGFALVSFGFL